MCDLISVPNSLDFFSSHIRNPSGIFFIHIGIGRFRILGGQGFEYWRGVGVQEELNSQHAHDVLLMSIGRNKLRCFDVVPTFFLINQCQIITFLILKSDIIENSRIEFTGIVLQVPSNQIKVTLIIILPFHLVHL